MDLRESHPMCPYSEPLLILFWHCCFINCSFSHFLFCDFDFLLTPKYRYVLKKTIDIYNICVFSTHGKDVKENSRMSSGPKNSEEPQILMKNLNEAIWEWRWVSGRAHTPRSMNMFDLKWHQHTRLNGFWEPSLLTSQNSPPGNVSHMKENCWK